MGQRRKRVEPARRQSEAAGTPARRVVGLFVEGSRGTDPLRDDFESMWNLLWQHCGHHDIDLKIVGISKGNIIELRDLQPRANATALVKNATQLSGGKESLDVSIQRLHADTPLDRVIIAFDWWRPNQEIPAKDRNLPCPMRPEVAFVLRKLGASSKLDDKFKKAARKLLERYDSRDTLAPRAGAMGPVEVLFMDPMFEALFIADEPTVRKALGVADKQPRDWPKFKTTERALDKAVLDPAVKSAIRGRHTYSSAKARWGHRIVKAAASDAKLWEHPLAQRLCRLLAAR
jgi:hypothetical protein